MRSILQTKGVGPALAVALEKLGITSSEQLASAQPRDLLSVTGIGPARAIHLISAAQSLLAASPRAAAAGTEHACSPRAQSVSDNEKLKRKNSKNNSGNKGQTLKALKKAVRKHKAKLEKQKSKLRKAKKELKAAA